MSTRITQVPTGDTPSSCTAEASKAPPRTRSIAHTTRTTPHPRWLLSLEAIFWRRLCTIGFFFNTLPSPSSISPSFKRQFLTTIVGEKEPSTLDLYFYVPSDYEEQRRNGKKYPAVVNFHGGGFTIGSSTDDGRWAGHVLKEVDAVVVGVEYRLAPEYPFPTAVEDGVEALLHLSTNTETYGIDHKKIAVSGFSAGGNLTISIPLRLYTHVQSINNEAESKALDRASPKIVLPELVAIISFYPNLDHRITRDERRATSKRPEKTLPPFFTNLFDEAYMPGTDDKESPFASPAAASDEDLIAALPKDIAMYFCEWDMLLQEGEVFAERLRGLGKNLHEVLIKDRRHGFDKNPYPFSIDPEVLVQYSDACGILRDAFDSDLTSPDTTDPVTSIPTKALIKHFAFRTIKPRDRPEFLSASDAYGERNSAAEMWDTDLSNGWERLCSLLRDGAVSNEPPKGEEGER